jgi:hypothetical protein
MARGNGHGSWPGEMANGNDKRVTQRCSRKVVGPMTADQVDGAMPWATASVI